MGNLYTRILALFALLITCACDHRRPIYNIAHMVNSIGEIEKYLDLGANMLEFDIQFYANGTVKEVYHGFPCDIGRYCDYRAYLQPYLENLRYITNPSTTPKNYADQMVMVYFDLKLSEKISSKDAGRDIARYVLHFLWSEDGQRKQEVRALMAINDIKYKNFIVGFMEEFKNRGKESRLKDVGFDGGSGDIEKIREMFASLGLEDNIWIGDGNTNIISTFLPDDRLREEIRIRDKPPSFIDKVYHWTIDFLPRMRRSLKLGVDGFITNLPQDLADLVQGPSFKNTSRLATPDDNPFERYGG